MTGRRVVPLILLAALAACDDSPTGTGDRLVLEPSFQTGATDGWVVDFADYPQADEKEYDLESGVRSLPAPLDVSRKALYVSGSNHSDDLFMFLKRRVEGLTPGATYRVRFEVELATRAGSGCVGIGGSPGESVYLKAGATPAEPTVVRESDGYLRLTVDKGQQAVGSASIPTIGDVSNGSDRCDGEAPYRLKTVDSALNQGVEPAIPAAIEATADSAGRLWLIVGTDSGFEGTTSLYYAGLRVTLERR